MGLKAKKLIHDDRALQGAMILISTDIEMPHMLSVNNGKGKVFSWCVYLVNFTGSVHNGNAVVMHV